MLDCQRVNIMDIGMSNDIPISTALCSSILNENLLKIKFNFDFLATKSAEVVQACPACGTQAAVEITKHTCVE